MSHAFLFVPAANQAEAPSFQKGVRALGDFKAVRITDTATSATASLAVAPAAKATQVTKGRIARSADGQVWIADLGLWLPLPAERERDATWLIEQYLTLGAEGLARRLQGLFALLIVDQRTPRQAHVITDRCGSLHVYWRQLADGVAVCSSSAVLAQCAPSTLDPVGVHEFIATGNIYEDRSLWRDIRKIGPATVLTLDPAGAQARRYWDFSAVEPERLNLEEAVEQTHHGLVAVLKALPNSVDCGQPLISDLTGGYDSRLLLTGLLDAQRPFHTTVSGSADHPDVTVAARIAAELKLQHQNISAPPLPTADEFDAAVRMTDGEFDAFDFARILHIHRRLAAGHGMSLNGSFGELARGYWWELLWPKLASHQPLDVARVARKRFAAIGYDKAIFASSAQLDLAAHMAAVAGRAVQPIAGYPNTTQMDCVYYSLRMQRWQGRIASSTNQLWPAFSPIGFAQVLDPVLAARADTRFRSLLARRLFQRFAPPLARIPLEHGYPPVPASPFNLWRFSPLLSHYGGKVLNKVAAKLGVASKPAAPTSRPDDAALMRDTGIAEWRQSPLILQTGLFNEPALRNLLDKNSLTHGPRVEQWRRLMTLEALQRKVQA
ncbi:MAG: asparagine synthase-related protein [Rhodocyclaceae bacterium]